jgi:hypothetical protein
MIKINILPRLGTAKRSEKYGFNNLQNNQVGLYEESLGDPRPIRFVQQFERFKLKACGHIRLAVSLLTQDQH